MLPVADDFPTLVRAYNRFSTSTEEWMCHRERQFPNRR
jgi:hypothetical protein